MRHSNVDLVDDSAMHLGNRSLMVIDAEALHDAAQGDGVTSFTDMRTGIWEFSVCANGGVPISPRCVGSPAKCSSVTV